MKEKYFEAEMEIVEFECEDVITTSGDIIPFFFPSLIGSLFRLPIKISLL